MKKNLDTTDYLAFIVVLGGGGLYAWLKEAAILALVTMVVSYYFGSSTGSKAKDKLLKDMEGKLPPGDPI